MKASFKEQIRKKIKVGVWRMGVLATDFFVLLLFELDLPLQIEFSSYVSYIVSILLRSLYFF